MDILIKQSLQVKAITKMECDGRKQKAVDAYLIMLSM